MYIIKSIIQHIKNINRIYHALQHSTVSPECMANLLMRNEDMYNSITLEDKVEHDYYNKH